MIPYGIEFAVGGGHTVDDRHKSRYPNYLFVVLPRRDAVQAIKDLTNQLGRPAGEDIVLPLFGEAKEYVE